MKQVAMKATFVAFVSILLSVAVGAIIFPGPYLLFDGQAWIMCIVCPLLIAWPGSAYTFWQKAKLRCALAEVRKSHDELSKVHRLLAEKARRDHMTGMLNRETFFSEMEAARTKSGRGTLLIIDADNFKQINDRYGHLAGDAALLQMCAAIEHAVRGCDLVGRIGGEEFGVFVVDADRTEAFQLAERIRESVAGIEFHLGQNERIPLSVSIGGTDHRLGAPLSELMREADRKLYQAKRRGRNLVIFEDYLAVA